MSPRLDRDLLRFAHGDAPLLARWRARIALALRPAARNRLAELRRTSVLAAAAFGEGGPAGFQARSHLRARRAAMVDALVLAAIVFVLIEVAVWRIETPRPQSSVGLSPIIVDGVPCQTEQEAAAVRKAMAARQAQAQAQTQAGGRADATPKRLDFTTPRVPMGTPASPGTASGAPGSTTR